MQQQKKELFRLVIVSYSDGTVGLSGPLDNKALCYGLLESAKDEVREHEREKRVLSTLGTAQPKALSRQTSNPPPPKQLGG